MNPQNQFSTYSLGDILTNANAMRRLSQGYSSVPGNTGEDENDPFTKLLRLQRLQQIGSTMTGGQFNEGNSPSPLGSFNMADVYGNAAKIRALGNGGQMQQPMTLAGLLGQAWR